MIDVVLIETGTANLASVRAALRRAGAEPQPATSAAQVRSAARVVLPGVGAFDRTRRGLADGGLDDAIRDRILADRPTLAVCVGLQVLADESEESSPGAPSPGLGLVPGTVRRLGGPGAGSGERAIRVPQMGWNAVTVTDDRAGCLRSGEAYFANSFALDPEPAAEAGWSVAVAVHGRPFAAAVERGATLACQFHPELSGAYGADLIAAWLAGGRSC